jgi:hypothetical protein
VWAINGCFSVVGIFSSRIAGLVWGFDRVLATGVALYIFCFICAWLYTRPRNAQASASA